YATTIGGGYEGSGSFICFDDMAAYAPLDHGDATNVVRALFDPMGWHFDDRIDIDEGDGQLVVRHTAEGHAGVQAVLGALRASFVAEVAVEAVLLTGLDAAAVHEALAPGAAGAGARLLAGARATGSAGRGRAHLAGSTQIGLPVVLGRTE